MKPITVKSVVDTTRHIFSLADDKSEAQAIDKEIRSNVSLRGTNLWVLMLAMLIASIGLDVNSTAVIIGAMLISPLMGPIMGIGYGIGVYDFPLIRKSALSLAMATLIAFLTATLYFMVSPLNEAQSELLARTSPTIWDVLIAFFGGLAGIIAATRKIKTNVIPGVAIATALMPPLATAGYGMANGEWSFFFGAFYLYIINSVFIAIASMIIISAMKLPHTNYVDDETEDKVRRSLFLLVFVTAVPSVYLAYNLVKEEVFTQQAKSFVSEEFVFNETYITNLKVEPKSRVIELSLIGKPLSKKTLEGLQHKLVDKGLEKAVLEVHQADQQTIDTLSLKSSIIADLYKDSKEALEVRDRKIAKLNEQLSSYKNTFQEMEELTPELHALFPEITNLMIGKGISSTTQFDIYHQKVTLLIVRAKKPLSAKETARLKEWLSARLKTPDIKLVYE